MTAIDIDATSLPHGNGSIIPPSWGVVRLGNVCEETQLVNPAAQPDMPFTYIDVSSVSNETFRVVEPRRLIGSEAPSRARKGIRAGDVLFATVRPTLRRVALVPDALDGGVASTGYCVVRANGKKLDSEFVYFYLLTRGVAELVDALQKGATYPAINDLDVFNLLIPLPPLAEQRAIARVLRAVREVIAARRRELALERERKAALMAHLFTHGTRGEATQQTAIGEMPESWRVVPFGQMCISSAYGPRFGAEHYSASGNVATVRTTDMDANGEINYRTMPRAELDLRRFKDHLLQRFDVLITRSGTCGIAAVFEEFEIPVLPGAFSIRFRLRREELDSYFVRYYINSPHGQARVSLLAVGAVQKNISGTSMLAFPIPVPSLEDQQQIVEVLQRQDRASAALSQEITLLEELFRALLEELMSGRLAALPLAEDTGTAEVAATVEGEAAG